MLSVARGLDDTREAPRRDDGVDETLDGVIDDFGYGDIDEPCWRYCAEVRFTRVTIAATEETPPGAFDGGLLTTVSGSLTVQMAEG